jgi:hypothetical protein
VIAISSKSQSFGAIAKYLVAGRSGEEWDRVAWTTSRNLPTADPELAGKIMRATAEQSDRVTRPVHHLALSFDPGDSVDRATMERVADDVLRRLGLDEYQVVMVAHCDREHQHVHLLVNRVHPETGRAWERSHDYRIIQQVLREEERALGLRQVPGRLARLAERGVPVESEYPTIERPHEPASLLSSDTLARELRTYQQAIALGQARIEAETSLQAAQARSDQLGIAIERAEQTSAAFDRALARVYRNPAEARVVFNQMVKGKGLDDAIQSLRSAPERFGTLRTVAHARLGGLVTERDETEARKAAGAAAEHGREAYDTERALWRIAAESRVRRLEDSLAQELSMAYREPSAARAQFLQMTAEHGTAHAVRILREQPESFGALRIAGDERHDTTERLHARLAAEAAMSIERARHELGGADRAAITPAAEHAAAQVAVEHARARADTVRAEELRRPRREEVHRRLVRAMHLLAPRELERLHAVLTRPQWALAQKLKATVRDAMLGRDEGVGQ